MEKTVITIEPSRQLPKLEKVGIYCRVSSTTPAQVHSLSAQASYLLRYALHNPGWIVEDIYIDIGSGSSIEKRDEFMRMLSDVKSGRLSRVIVKSISRFGRNTEEILITYRLITSLGGAIFFEEQDLDSRLPDSEMYVSMYGAVAQAENTNLSENMKWAIRKRAEDGSSTIYNRVCYGYRVNKEGEFEIAPKEASVVREVFSLYIGGYSVLKIKRYLEGKGISSPTGKTTWSKRTIETMLENKKYIGTSVIYKTYQHGYPQPKRIINKGTHDVYEMSDHHVPIIPKEIYEKAQEIRAERSNIEIDEEGNTRRKAKKYSSAKIILSQEEENKS